MGQTSSRSTQAEGLSEVGFWPFEAAGAAGAGGGDPGASEEIKVGLVPSPDPTKTTMGSLGVVDACPSELCPKYPSEAPDKGILPPPGLMVVLSIQCREPSAEASGLRASS